MFTSPRDNNLNNSEDRRTNESSQQSIEMDLSSFSNEFQKYSSTSRSGNIRRDRKSPENVKSKLCKPHITAHFFDEWLARRENDSSKPEDVLMKTLNKNGLFGNEYQPIRRPREFCKDRISTRIVNKTAEIIDDMDQAEVYEYDGKFEYDYIHYLLGKEPETLAPAVEDLLKSGLWTFNEENINALFDISIRDRLTAERNQKLANEKLSEQNRENVRQNINNKKSFLILFDEQGPAEVDRVGPITLKWIEGVKHLKTDLIKTLNSSSEVMKCSCQIEKEKNEFNQKLVEVAESKIDSRQSFGIVFNKDGNASIYEFDSRDVNWIKSMPLYGYELTIIIFLAVFGFFGICFLITRS